MTRLDTTTVNLSPCSYKSCRDTRISHTSTIITVHYQKEIGAKYTAFLGEGYFFLSLLLLSTCCLGVFVVVFLHACDVCVLRVMESTLSINSFNVNRSSLNIVRGCLYFPQAIVTVKTAYGLFIIHRPFAFFLN